MCSAYPAIAFLSTEWIKSSQSAALDGPSRRQEAGDLHIRSPLKALEPLLKELVAFDKLAKARA